MRSMWTAALNRTTGLPHGSEVSGSEFERFQCHISTCQADVLRRLAEVRTQNRARWYHSQAWPRSISAGLVYKW